MVLDYHVNGSRKYNVITKLPLASIISPQFVRRRADKSVVSQDIRIAQVTDLVDVPGVNRDSRQMTLPVSEILRREVYTKELKGQSMVRKFLLWQTNKQTGNDEFPAYVAHYTDFSPNRKDALAREILVSSSRSQIKALFEELKQDNVKSGWQRIASTESPPIAATAQVPAVEELAGTEPAPAAVDSVAADEPGMAPSLRKKRVTRKKTG
jgi:hypothetical protein